MYVCMYAFFVDRLGSLCSHPYDERVPRSAAHRRLVDGVPELPGDSK